MELQHRNQRDVGFPGTKPHPIKALGLQQAGAGTGSQRYPGREGASSLGLLSPPLALKGCDVIQTEEGCKLEMFTV